MIYWFNILYCLVGYLCGQIFCFSLGLIDIKTTLFITIHLLVFSFILIFVGIINRRML